MKVLVASGSFKDVFSPSEAVNMLEKVFINCGYEVAKCPFCDGGEYTYDVLKETLSGYREIIVENVTNVYGKKVDSRYLIDTSNIAHIVSSEILRLYPEEDEYKNPLELTDFGYGQLIADAVERDIHEIKLYLGGTSTVDFGMGMLQALGGKLYDAFNVLLESPVTPKDLSRISRIQIDKSLFEDINVIVIADGDAKADEMDGITRLKIGKTYRDSSEDIVMGADLAAQSVVHATGFGYKRPFSGAAGGLLFGIDCVFNARYILGGDYFVNLLELKKKIMDCDYVVTGEGRYDNTACGKAPASIASIASSLGKPVALICGQVDKQSLHKHVDYGSGIINDLKEAKELGITKIITCQGHYDEHPSSGSYKEQTDFYRKMTPQVLETLIKGIIL